MYPPELESKIAEWRAMCAEGTMTPEIYKEVITHLREGRLTALTAPKAPRKTAAKKSKKVAETPASPEELAKQLEI
jgi:hypothetical protein